METVSAKIGASIGILSSPFLLSRYLFQSIRQVMACYICVEIFSLAIILFLTGLSPLTWFDLSFNISWLHAMTWNVTVVFIIGSALGLRLRNGYQWRGADGVKTAVLRKGRAGSKFI